MTERVAHSNRASTPALLRGIAFLVLLQTAFRTWTFWRQFAGGPWPPNYEGAFDALLIYATPLAMLLGSLASIALVWNRHRWLMVIWSVLDVTRAVAAVVYLARVSTNNGIYYTVRNAVESYGEYYIPMTFFPAAVLLVVCFIIRTAPDGAALRCRRSRRTNEAAHFATLDILD